MVREGSRWFKVRIALILLAFACGLVVVLHKAYSLQILEGSRYRQMAEEQYLREIETPGKRGAITDRNGENLAVSTEVESVFIQPGVFLQDRPAEHASLLGRALRLNSQTILSKLKRGKHFVWVKRRISEAESAAVAKLALKGVSTVKEFRRFYPMKSLGAHVVGFTDIDGEGQGGVERFFNNSLKGQSQFVNGLRDALGREVFEEGSISEADFEGHRLELAIDVNIQSVVEVEIEKAVRERHARGGWAVVMDPATGEVLALANHPTFDPNEPSRAGDAARNNQALTNPFEPGSTMKSFLLAAALEDRVVRPEDRFDCEGGQYPIGSRVIHDAHPHGVLTVAETIKVSSNICSAKIGLKMGRERLYRNLRGFGFGEPTGIALPAESRGILAEPDRWADINTATISFGQGISVTAVQLAAAFSALANGGDLVRPIIVRRIINTKGEVVKSFAPEVVRKAVSPSVARTSTGILATVTEAGGTGTQAAVEGFRVAGKTGTAQKVDGTRGYSVDKRIGLFAGFVPVDRPKLVLVVAIDEPKGVAYGGVVAAPAFRAIASAALKNMGVFPKGAPEPEIRPGPREDEEVVEPAGEGYSDLPAAAGAVPTGDRVPGFVGLPLRRVIEIGVEAGIEIEVEGSGRAVHQDPPPGAKFPKGRKCRVVFGKPESSSEAL
jgi:cell division protein FtsI (penicillin-binding protein 3)